MSYLPVRPNTAVSLFQHGNPNGYRGMGEYERVGDWGWEFLGPTPSAGKDRSIQLHNQRQL